MIIEFIGLPGAGKSTLTTPLVKLTGEKGWHTANFTTHHHKLMGSFKGKMLFALFVLRRWRQTYGLIRLIDKANPGKRQIKDRIFKLFIMIFEVHNYCSKNRNGDAILILDQGIFQMIGSIYLRLGTQNKLDIDEVTQRAFRLMELKRKYIVVKVDLPMTVTINRIYQRDKTNCEFKSLDEHVLTKRFELYEEFFSKVKPILTVSSDTHGVSKNVQLIYQKLFDNRYEH